MRICLIVPLIASVIKLCHSVGITVCVEGVEEQDELRAVCDLDADSIQGYYISRPSHPRPLKKNTGALSSGRPGPYRDDTGRIKKPLQNQSGLC